MKKLLLVIMSILIFNGLAFAADYMTPEEITRIWGDGGDYENVYKFRGKSQPKNVADIIDEYAQAAAFIQTMQYLEPDDDFGGIMEGEHLLDIIQTDNTSESVWIWCRYYQLTGDNQYYQNVLNSWQYMYRWPAWREEGGSNPGSGYYRYYGGGWGLLAEMIYRDAYASDTFRVYADSVADYMIGHYLEFYWRNIMVYAWAMGCLHLYGVDVGVQEYVDYADSVAAEIKIWVEENPSARLNREQWAMSGGAILWGLANSYFLSHPEEAYDWFTENAPYIDTLDTVGSWHLAHNAWYAIGHWTAFEMTGDSTYLYNHAFLTDTLLAQDGDDDGGIPAEFDDTDDMDQSWCTAYLGFMCFNPLLYETSVDDQPQPLPYDYVTVSNYPNPFNNRTNINFYGFDRGNLRADVFDLMGRRVDTIFEGETPGSGLISWDATGLASGIYFIRLGNSRQSRITRAMLIK